MSKIFISGEGVNLCAPEADDFSTWADWFNNEKTTKFLEQGKFPNTYDNQLDFYRNAISQGRFIALIKTKNGKLLGVISLSDINYEKRSCQIALVCPVKDKDVRFAPLEAMAMATQHAFERFDVKRVWAGQAYPGLMKWSKMLEVIGYKAEGIIRFGFKSGRTHSHSLLISITENDYLNLSERRGGSLWPGQVRVRMILDRYRDRNSLATDLDIYLAEKHKENDDFLINIENSFDE